MTGPTRAAALLLALGEECAAAVLARMQNSPGDLTRLGAQIRNAGRVSGPQCQEAVTSLLDDLDLGRITALENDQFVSSVLERALPTDKSQKMRRRVGLVDVPDEVSELNWLASERLIERMSELPSQAAAAIVALLETRHGADVLDGMGHRQATDYIARIATLGPVNAGLLVGTLKHEPMVVRDAGVIEVDGPRTAARLLLKMEPTMRFGVMANLEQQWPEVASEVQLYLFTFADLATAQAASMQLILREVSLEVVVIALHGAPADVVENVTTNLSSRAQAALREDIETLGVVSPSEVESARGEMLVAARKVCLSG